MYLWFQRPRRPAENAVERSDGSLPTVRLFPGTEELEEDEIRLIACAPACQSARVTSGGHLLLAELGNGDKFLFDIGTGAIATWPPDDPFDFLDTSVPHPSAH